MLKLDKDLGILRTPNKDYSLTLKEVNLLKVLKDRKYHSLEDLKMAVWGSRGENYTISVLRVLVFRLRKKTGIRIKAKFEFGYILLDKIEEFSAND